MSKTAAAPTQKPDSKNAATHQIQANQHAEAYSTFGVLPDMKDVDWTNKESMLKVFPQYIQEQIALARAKNVSKSVKIECFSVKKPLTADYLIRDAALTLDTGRKIVLVGDPSSGKTTLLSAIASKQIPDFPKHLHVHHCKEIGMTKTDVSVLDAVVLSHEFRNVLLACKKELVSRLEKFADKEEDDDEEKSDEEEEDEDDSGKEGLRSNLEFVNFQLTKISSDLAYERAAKMLRVLGFDDDKQKKSTNSLSGGLRMRVALCAAFFIEADLLLLDEPTNHLDFPSVLWLENRLRGYRGSFVLISHDRELLENVCNQLIHLTEKKLVYYNCGFKEFETKKAAAEKKKDADIDAWMAKYRNVDPSSSQGREKAEKKAWSEAYALRQTQLAGKFTFPKVEPLPKLPGDPENPAETSLINLENVRFSYDEAKGLPFIFDTPISLNVRCNTRMGVMGPNGAGKSTLLKLLTKRLIPTSGTVTTNPGATVAYFAQHHAAELDLNQTPIEYMVSQFPKVSNSGLLRKHLEKVGIAGLLADTRMVGLSSGQRSCVMFAKITYICPHLLIMDEPTNFLDLESVDSLISATNKFTGALLLVSHNRGMLKKCANKYLSVVPGHFNIYDDVKSCERATYSFIQELEEGGSVGKIGASALTKKAGPAPAADAKTAAAPGTITIASTAATPAATTAATPAAAAPTTDVKGQPQVKAAEPAAKPAEVKTAPVAAKPADTKPADTKPQQQQGQGQSRPQTAGGNQGQGQGQSRPQTAGGQGRGGRGGQRRGGGQQQSGEGGQRGGGRRGRGRGGRGRGAASHPRDGQ